MRFEIDQTACPRNGRVIGRRVLQADPDEITQGQRIRRAPRDATLRVNAFEVADQQQPEVDAGRQAGPAHRLGVEARALRFSEIVESVLAQELIHPPIEGVLTARRSVTATHI